MGKLNLEKTEPKAPPTDVRQPPPPPAGPPPGLPGKPQRARKILLFATVGTLVAFGAMLVIWSSDSPIADRTTSPAEPQSGRRSTPSTPAPTVTRATASAPPTPALTVTPSRAPLPDLTPAIRSYPTPLTAATALLSYTPIPTPVPTPFALVSALPGERFPETRVQQMTAAIVSSWTAEQIRYAINEMYARHGADFLDGELNKWFAKFNWYHRRPGVTYDDVEKSFTPLETENVKLLGYFRDVRKAGVPPQSPRPTQPPAPTYDGAVAEPTPDTRTTWYLVYAPRPMYPDAARTHRISGSGRFRINFDAQGTPRSVEILNSTRNKLLDQSAVTALKKWRATPGAARDLVVPVSFTDPLPSQ